MPALTLHMRGYPAIRESDGQTLLVVEIQHKGKVIDIRVVDPRHYEDDE